MSIRLESRKVADYLLNKATKYGTFKNTYPLMYDELGEVIGISPNDCRLFCEYLESIGCIKLIDGQNEDEIFHELKVNPAIVDFLEKDLS